MLTHEAQVTGWFRVTIDETKFTDDFLAEFREHFYPFDTVRDHVEHLAQLFGRGVINGSTDFVEGYGPPADFGIRFDVVERSVPRPDWSDVPVEIDLTAMETT